MLNVIKDKFQIILNDKNVIEDKVFDIKLFRAQKILPEVGYDEPRRHLFGPETCT